MAKQNLLVVDADQRSLRVLEVSLRKAGYSVAACTDVNSALEMLDLSPPDLIISDTRLPGQDGFAFIEEIRKHKSWADIPFMFLSSDVSVESKVRGLELGVEDYLTKPIYIREIITRVNLVISRRTRADIETRGSAEKAKFTGSLADMGLVDLLQTIDIGKKSGVLYLTSGRQRGAVYFRDGQLVDAELGDLKGERAIYRALVWSEGAFEIDFRPVRREDVIRISTQGILMEGIRRMDEWGRLLEQLPPLERVFEVNDEALLERLAEIPDEINDVLKHFDGEQSLLSVVDACGGDDLETLTTISKLYFEGLIFDTGRTKTSAGSASRRPPRVSLSDAPSTISSEPPPPITTTSSTAMTVQPPALGVDDVHEGGLVPGRESMFPAGSAPARNSAVRRPSNPQDLTATPVPGAPPEELVTTLKRRTPADETPRTTHSYGSRSGPPDVPKDADSTEPATPVTQRGLHAVPPVAEADSEDERDDDNNVIRLRPGGTLRLVREPVPEPPVDALSPTLVEMRPAIAVEPRAIHSDAINEAVGGRDTAEDFGRAVRAPVPDDEDDDEDDLPDGRDTRPSTLQVEGGGRRKRKRHRRLSITTSPGIVSAALMRHTPTGPAPQPASHQSAPEPERPPSRPTQPDGVPSPIPIPVPQPPKPAGAQTIMMASFSVPASAPATDAQPTTIARPLNASKKTLVGISVADTETAPAAKPVTAPVTAPEFTMPVTPATGSSAAMPAPSAARPERDDLDDAATRSTDLDPGATHSNGRSTGERGWQDSESETSVRPITPPKRGKFAPAMIALIAAATFFALYATREQPKPEAIKPSAPAQKDTAPEPTPEAIAVPAGEAPEVEEPVAEVAPVAPDEEPAVAGAAPIDSPAAYEDAMKRARELDRKANTKGAIAAYEEALALDANSSEALGKLAFHQLNRGKNAEAIELANRAVAADPTNSEGWIVLGAARHALHDREGAREAYRKCAELGTGSYVQECRHMLR